MESQESTSQPVTGSSPKRSLSLAQFELINKFFEGTSTTRKTFMNLDRESFKNLMKKKQTSIVKSYILNEYNLEKRQNITPDEIAPDEIAPDEIAPDKIAPNKIACNPEWNNLRLIDIKNPSDLQLNTLFYNSCIGWITLISMNVDDFIQTMKTIPDGGIKNSLVDKFNMLKKRELPIEYKEVLCTGTSCTVFINNLHHRLVEPVQGVAASAVNFLGPAVAGKPSSGGNRLQTRRTKNRKNKTRKHQEKVIFVFYTFAQGGSWTYKKLPSGWWWVGSGSTAALKEKELEYKREEQFQGPAKTQDKTMLYLDKVFTKLKQDGVISKFKLRKP